MNAFSFSKPIFSIGQTHFSPQTLMVAIGSVLILILIVRFARKIFLKRISRYDVGRRGALTSLSRFVSYLVLMIGFIIIFQANGVDLTTLTMLTSAIGIGIGFGLQSITSNLISGIIILFERPIKVGDRIEVGSVAGDVVEISIRASTILTNDNISVIVPNSEFITQRVTNWSFNDASIRSRVQVGVSYDSDTDLVKEALLKVASSHPGVLQDPKSDVLFSKFGDSALIFVLRFWTKVYSSRIGVLQSDLNFEILKEFRKLKINIPFPQVEISGRLGKDD